MRNVITLTFLTGVLALSACRGGDNSATTGSLIPATDAGRGTSSTQARLGNILSTEDGGQIFGFDINQNGSDGVLASSRTTNQPGVYQVSVETFDQNTGAITSSFAVETGNTNSYAVDGIFFGDVALVTHFVTPNGSLIAQRRFQVMNPVTAQKFTGNWTPPASQVGSNIDILQSGVNQSTSTSVLFADELSRPDNSDLIVSDIAHNTFSKIIHLNASLFQGANGPQMAQYTSAGKAVIALSPSAGAAGGAAPINVVIDLKTGTQTQFTGFNNGYYGAGYVNGIAVDPTTGVTATTTELNAQVEFYDVVKRAGIAAVQLPCTNDTAQYYSGAGIAVDPVHKLFLVTNPNYACTGGSAILVYDEKGALVEKLIGFKFVIAEPPPVLNPNKRMGWAFGPGFNQLQQFFY